MFNRLRLLPTVMLCAAMLLTLKLADIASGGAAISPAQASASKAAEEAASEAETEDTKAEAEVEAESEGEGPAEGDPAVAARTGEHWSQRKLPHRSASRK